VWEDSAPPVTATEVVMNSVGEVSIPSQGATLAGSMYVPTSINGKASGIVLVHGSDPNDRFRGVIPSFYARQGYVVLTFDKRGNGGSTGSFGTATLDTLADDVAAAVRFLAADPRVDASRIGLWGISQGGWVVPLAIQRGVRAAFVILHSGATLSPMEQGHDELRGMLRARQLPEDEIARAVAYQRLYNNTVVNPALAPALDSLYAAERTRGATWLWSPQSVAANRSRIWARMLDYDPAPALRTLKMPVLALFGAMDHLVPPERHVAPLLTALREIGNNDVTVAVFPHGNHRLEVATPGVLQDWMIASRIVPGYFSTIEEWLERQHHKPRQ
jgi:pimeloyl-ACP methyl ester carboxylesterase